MARLAVAPLPCRRQATRDVLRTRGHAEALPTAPARGLRADCVHAFVSKSVKPGLRPAVPPPLPRERMKCQMEVVQMKLGIATGVIAIVLSASTAHATMHNGSLYSRLGGKPAIRLVVEDFVQNVAEDRRINGFFGTTNIPRLNRLLLDHSCHARGGTWRYSGRRTSAAHPGLGIGNADFNALVQDLGRSLNKYGVPAREQRELTAILLPLKRDIVTR